MIRASKRLVARGEVCMGDLPSLALQRKSVYFCKQTPFGLEKGVHPAAFVMNWSVWYAYNFKLMRVYDRRFHFLFKSRDRRSLRRLRRAFMTNWTTPDTYQKPKGTMVYINMAATKKQVIVTEKEIIDELKNNGKLFQRERLYPYGLFGDDTDN